MMVISQHSCIFIRLCASYSLHITKHTFYFLVGSISLNLNIALHKLKCYDQTQDILKTHVLYMFNISDHGLFRIIIRY